MAKYLRTESEQRETQILFRVSAKRDAALASKLCEVIRVEMIPLKCLRVWLCLSRLLVGAIVMLPNTAPAQTDFSAGKTPEQLSTLTAPAVTIRRSAWHTVATHALLRAFYVNTTQRRANGRRCLRTILFALVPATLHHAQR